VYAVVSCMLVVDQSLSFLNAMLHHPSVFKLDTVKQQYTSKSTLNSQVRLDTAALCLPYTQLHYASLQAKIRSNRDFDLFLVFKLLERGIYISARNVAMVEKEPVAASDESVCVTDKIKLINHLANSRQHIVHCDIIAFHAKKRHIYAIVVCDNVMQLQQCRTHAQRVAMNIRRINPCFSLVLPYVLTVYDFENAETMRLCAVPSAKHAKHDAPRKQRNHAKNRPPRTRTSPS